MILTRAARSLTRSPVFVTVAVLSLSLGIAAATGFFSVVNAVLFRTPPHVADPDGLVAIYSSYEHRLYGPSSYPDFVDIRQQAELLESAAAVSDAELMVRVGSEAERRLLTEIVSEDYFNVLGVRMALGRGFAADDQRLDWNVAVIGHRMWQRDFGGDPQVVGKSVLVEGRPHTVVGVAPRGLLARRSPIVLDLWIPVRSNWRDSRGVGALGIVGRLRPGADLSQLQAQLDVVGARLAEEYPKYWRDRAGTAERITAIPERQAMLPPENRGAIFGIGVLLVIAIGLVLLVACSNVANLMLSRATRRRVDIALRLALGAGRRRVVAELLAESLLIGGLAGGLGLAMTATVLHLTASGRGPFHLPVTLDFAVDWRVAAFSVLLAMVCACAFGLAPAATASRLDLVAVLKGHQRFMRFRRLSLRNLLVVAQVAGSLILVVGFALLLRSFEYSRTLDLGYEPQGVAVASLDLGQRQQREESGRQLFASLEERLKAVPGVEAVALGRTVLLGGVQMYESQIEPEGHAGSQDEHLLVGFNIVEPGYFELLGMLLERGRDFTASDGADAPRVMVVNRAFAQQFWPGQDPIGKTVAMDQPTEVIGVVQDAVYHEVTEDHAPFFWVPFPQRYSPQMTVHVRTSSDPGALLRQIRDEVRSLDPLLPVGTLDTLDSVVAEAIRPQQVVSLVLGAVGTVTLGLAMLGIYGVLAYAVSLRRREMGIRIALGASPRELVAHVLRDGVGLASVGLTVGLGCVLLVGQLLRAVLVGVSPLDPASLGSGLLVLSVAVVAASLPPAVRAARTDPVESLREE